MISISDDPVDEFPLDVESEEFDSLFWSINDKLIHKYKYMTSINI